MIRLVVSLPMKGVRVKVQERRADGSWDTIEVRHLRRGEYWMYRDRLGPAVTVLGVEPERRVPTGTAPLPRPAIPVRDERAWWEEDDIPLLNAWVDEPTAHRRTAR